MLFIAKFKENPMLPPIVAAHAFWAGKIQHCSNDDNLMACASKLKIARGVPGEPIYK